MHNLNQHIKSFLSKGIVLLDVVQDSQRQSLKIVVDSNKTIDIKTTAKIAKAIRNSEIFDSLCPEGRQMEVTSPGIDAPLQHPFQFKKNLGRKIIVVEKGGQKNVFTLVSAEKDGFEGRRSDGEIRQYDYSHVQSVKVLIEFK